MALIVVSNRIARPSAEEAATGGLAAALLPAVAEAGATWVGASGALCPPGTCAAVAKGEPLGKGVLATVDMPEEHYDRFYEGFANSVLWPAMHARVDLIRFSTEDYASYRAVNAFMARSLLPMVRPDSTLWIHDYHFLTLAEELRALGVRQPIGFFLHTPFPSRPVMTGVPHHRTLVQAMLAYDLLGFQTEDDAANFREYVQRELGLVARGGQVFSSGGRITRIAAFPIGINVEAFAERAGRAAHRAEVTRLRSSLQGRKLIIGVDRLDYSKGLPNRLNALDHLLTAHPKLKKTLHMLQIAVPSRTRIASYMQLRQQIAGMVGEINGRQGDVDWTPIRYVNRSYPHDILSGFYREADVGLITPLHDGMNLVAKEYVAAQDPQDPGILVLSEFAGAAQQLDAAVLVNPHDIEGTAEGLRRALVMPLEERRERWTTLHQRLKESGLDGWFADFVHALGEVGRRKTAAPPPIVPRSGLGRLHVVGRQG